jgi:hypothetical protein
MKDQMQKQIVLPAERRIKIEMEEKNLSRRYVRKSLRMKDSLFSMALAGKRKAALDKIILFVQMHKPSPTYLTK